MKKITTLFVLIYSLSMFAQRTCGTNDKTNEKINNDPSFRARHQAILDQIRNPHTAELRAAAPAIVVTIPVVVHVLYKTAAQNISDAQINSQITVLNNDFRKLNADFFSRVPAVFQPYGADMEINFVLAKRTPANVTTTGIERKSVASSFNFGNSYYTSSGLVAWDPTKYLNIWVGIFTGADAGILGWAYLPDNAGAPDDGLAIGYQYFGVGSIDATYNLGRTATHEIGHYFGLDHPWGEGNTAQACGVGGNSDGVADTPSTSREYYGTPTFPANTYACTPSTNGSMFMNYMDYVDDNWMAFFTAGQKVIMQNTLGGPRSSLLTSLGGTPLANESFEAQSISIYPNPAATTFTISSPKVTVDALEIYNNIGQRIKTQSVSADSVINIEELSTGIYYLKIFSEGKYMKTEKLIKR